MQTGARMERMMTSKQLKQTASKIHRLLDGHYPDSVCTLHFKNPLQLLVATILAAQCTDERVNIVTKNLFKKYRTVNDFADANLDDLMEDIHSTGFYRNKAKNIKSAATALIHTHGGKVPDSLDALVALPGVGRKTANVILGNAYGIPGMVVDTHVSRVSRRLGLTINTDPVKIEFDLMALFPKESWTLISHQLVQHGRNLCDARKPMCGDCFLLSLCPHGKTMKEDAWKKGIR